MNYHNEHILIQFYFQDVQDNLHEIDAAVSTKKLETQRSNIQNDIAILELQPNSSHHNEDTLVS